MKSLYLTLALAGVLFFGFAFAQEAKEEEKKADDTQKSEKKEEEQPEFPPLQKIVKDFQKIEGLYTLYRKNEQLYGFIKKDQLEQMFLIAISISGGPEFTGWQWNTILVKWERVDKHLLLIRPNWKHRTGKKTPLSEVVEKTYSDSVIHAVPIASADDSGNVLVDFNEIFKKDLGEIGWLMDWILGGASLASDLSSWSKIKVFPENIELEVKAVFMGKGDDWMARYRGLVADGRGVRMSVHYSLSLLPDTGYNPRQADDRIGYFLTVHKDYSRPYDSKTEFQRCINRWHLEKADEDLEISPAKKPIIFYIEKTVPVRFRHYIKQGIMEWNKAFEKVGIVDAMIVRQQTDREFADLDPEDVRYNFFRWITSGIPYAMGPSRVNPITGQILDADIVFDDSFTRVLHYEYRLWGPEAIAHMFDKRTYDKLQKLPAWQQLFEKRISHRAPEEDFPWQKIFNNPRWQKRWGENSHRCDCATGLSYQLALASLLFQTENTGKIPEKYLGQVVKELAMHEVGHTLGLRHNFKASSWLKLKDINVQEKPPEVISGSVMDYNAINMVMKGTPQGNYQTGSLGPYDYWVIEYGYGIPGKEDKEEDFLKKIAQKAASPELIYATDEDTSLLDPDPHTNRWDMGDDMLAFAKDRYGLFVELKENVLKKTVAEGESYAQARHAFETMLWHYTYASILATRYIGGEHVHRDHRGDPKARPPFVVVPVEKQREALQFLAEEVLSGKSMQFSPEFLNHLAPGRWGHWGSDEYDYWIPFPIHMEILWSQMLPVIFMLAPWTVERLHDMELQVPADKEAITVPELFRTTTAAIFAELDQKDLDKQTFTNRRPFITSIRRGLQQEYLAYLIFIGTEAFARYFYPGDVSAVVNQELKNLVKTIDALLQRENVKFDQYSQSHLLECKRLIEKALYGDKGRDKQGSSSSSGQ